MGTACAAMVSVAIGLATLGALDAKAQGTANTNNPLEGYFGKSPEQCRSYNRKYDNITTIMADEYSFCGGSVCGLEIKLNRKTANGYILKLKSYQSKEVCTKHFKEVSANVFEVRDSCDNGIETLVRCSKKDIAAGVGRKPDSSGNATDAIDHAFAAYYARLVPSRCNTLKVDYAATTRILALSQVAWAAHLKRYNLQPLRLGDALEHGVAEDIANEEKSARYAVESDSKALADFCEEAIRALGPNGSVIPDLLIDSRKRAGATPSSAS